MTEEIFLTYFEVRILTKTLKVIQMFQLGVGHSQMHAPFFFFPASVISFVYKPAAVLRMWEGIKLVNF